jgi:hypothetical protein
MKSAHEGWVGPAPFEPRLLVIAVAATAVPALAKNSAGKFCETAGKEKSH